MIKYATSNGVVVVQILLEVDSPRSNLHACAHEEKEEKEIQTGGSL